MADTVAHEHTTDKACPSCGVPPLPSRVNGVSPLPFARAVIQAHADMEGPRKDPFVACVDEGCEQTPTVRLSIGGQAVYACTAHARIVVAS